LKPRTCYGVSLVTKTLNAAVTAFHHQPLQNRYKALVRDGVVLTLKTGADALRRPVLELNRRGSASRSGW